jgi:hypothetical protein
MAVNMTHKNNQIIRSLWTNFGCNNSRDHESLPVSFYSTTSVGRMSFAQLSGHFRLRRTAPGPPVPRGGKNSNIDNQSSEGFLSSFSSFYPSTCRDIKTAPRAPQLHTLGFAAGQLAQGVYQDWTALHAIASSGIQVKCLLFFLLTSILELDIHVCILHLHFLQCPHRKDRKDQPACRLISALGHYCN